MKMMGGMMDAKKNILDELMSYLDHRDGMDLGEAVKPKGSGVEVTKIQKVGDGHEEPDGDESPGVLDQGDSKPDMSDDEMDELIEALKSKLGS